MNNIGLSKILLYVRHFAECILDVSIGLKLFHGRTYYTKPNVERSSNVLRTIFSGLISSKIPIFNQNLR